MLSKFVKLFRILNGYDPVLMQEILTSWHSSHFLTFYFQFVKKYPQDTFFSQKDFSISLFLCIFAPLYYVRTCKGEL